MEVRNCNAWIQKDGGDEYGVDYNKVKGYVLPEFEFTYTERDLIIYALGVGAASGDPTSNDVLRWTYENHRQFGALPTFGVIAPFDCVCQLMSVPGLRFNPALLLHGETELTVHAPIPTAATLYNRGHIVDIYDKGKASIVVVSVDSFDKDGTKIFTNVYSFFIRGIGGFGGPSGPAVKAPPSEPPKRAADVVVREQTLPSQALLYRLAG